MFSMYKTPRILAHNKKLITCINKPRGLHSEVCDKVIQDGAHSNKLTSTKND